MAWEFLANSLRQVHERLERIPVARYQPAGPGLDVRDRSEPIQLRLP
jgi:hypothetical protein